MTSLCLSAAGLRFLDRPAPTGAFGRPYGWLTDHSQFPIGVPTFRTIELRLGWVPSILRGRGVLTGDVWAPPATEAWSLSVMLLTRHCRLSQSSCPATSIYEASAKIHLRSPVQSFPGLGRVDD